MSARPRFVETSKGLLRETVLMSVDELVREHRWSELSMAKVADAAGVSRQTLYNVFGTRDELVGAYVLWAADALLDDIERIVDEHRHDLRAALRAGFERFLTVAPEHPLVRALVASAGSDDLHTLVSTPAGQPLVLTASARLGQIIAGTWPALPADVVETAADLLVRLALSNVTIPTRTQEEAAAGLDLLIGPYLDAISATFP
jgi:AcrR family transcriptional regulator